MTATSLGSFQLTSQEYKFISEGHPQGLAYDIIEQALHELRVVNGAGGLTKFGKLAKAEYEERQAQKAQYVLPLEG